MQTTEAIWSSFHQELYGFIRHSIRDDETSKDVLQDVFYKIHIKKHTLKDEHKLISWVWQITRNTVLDHIRAQKHFTELPEYLPYPTGEPNFNSLFARTMRPFIHNLPEDSRDAILLVDLEGMSQKEYALKTGISYTAAKSRVQRARKQLKELFEQCCKTESDIYGNIVNVTPKRNCGCEQRLNDHYLVSSL